MRKLLASLCVASAALGVVAQEPKPAEQKKPVAVKKAAPVAARQARPARPEPTLKVWDAPPALVADQWLQGDEVKSFEKGKIYVVEFWATWCGPCIVMMPHMAEMQAEYRDKGVTFIGFTKKDQNNSLEKVEEFVKKRGPKLGYTFCFAEEPTVYQNWMTAAGQNGIPCCFVVDRETKIAYIGHPMYLDLVLPKLVDGKWTDADVKKIDDVEKEVSEVFASFSGSPEVAMKTLASFEKKYPAMNKVPYFVSPKLSNMLKLKKFDELKIAARNLMKSAIKNSDDSLLGNIANALRGPDAKGQKDLLAISVSAAEEALKLAGDKDMRALLGVAQSNLAAGDAKRGKEFAEKVLAVADARSKSSITMMLASTAITAGDKKLGLEFADKAIEAGGERMKASLEAQLVGAFLSAGDKKDAEEYAKKALESAADTAKPGIKATLARTYLTAGDKATGDKYAKEAVEEASDASKPIMMYQLAMAYYGANEKIKARDLAEQAIEKAPEALQRQLKPALQRILNDPEGKASDK